MIRPSPLTRVTNSSPTETERSISRERAVLVTTTLLSAIWVPVRRRSPDGGRPQHETLFDARAARERGLERGIELGERDLGEKPEAAEVDAEYRNRTGRCRRCGRPCRAACRRRRGRARYRPPCQRLFVAHRPVAGRRAQRRRRRLEDGLEAVIFQPDGDVGQMRRRLPQMMLRHDADAGDAGNRADRPSIQPQRTQRTQNIATGGTKYDVLTQSTQRSPRISLFFSAVSAVSALNVVLLQAM